MTCTFERGYACRSRMRVRSAKRRLRGTDGQGMGVPRPVSCSFGFILLEAARSRRPPLPEIVLWIAASRSPSESQTSECSDLLSRSRATFVIVAQRQPGKLHIIRLKNTCYLPISRQCGYGDASCGGVWRYAVRRVHPL